MKNFSPSSSLIFRTPWMAALRRTARSVSVFAETCATEATPSKIEKSSIGLVGL
jgi:hypothetical protein